MLERSRPVCLLVRDPVSFPSRPCLHRKFSLVCTRVLLSLPVVRFGATLLNLNLTLSPNDL